MQYLPWISKSEGNSVRRSISFALPAVFLFSFLLAGCGSGSLASNGGPSPTPTPGISPTPSPSPSPSPTPQAAKATRFVYVTNGGNTVTGFSLDPSTGASSPLAQGAVTVGDGFPHSLAHDPQGRFLFVSAQADRPHGNQVGHDEVASFRINPADGSLTPVGTPTILTNPAGAIVVSADGRFLYMSLIQGILVFSIDQGSGALALVKGSPFVIDPNTATLNVQAALAIDPQGRFLYQAQTGNFGGVGQVAVYALNRGTGIPTPVAGSPFETSPTPFFAETNAADPLGRFVFTGGSISAPNLDVESVNGSGALSPAPGSPFPTNNDIIFSITADPAGKFLYVSAGVQKSGIFGYRIDATGALTMLTGSPFAPNGALTTDASGRFLLIGTGGLLVYTIDPSSGALTFASGNPADTGSTQTAITAVAF